MLNLRHLMNDPSLGQFDIREDLAYEKVYETREDLVSFALSANTDIKSLLADRDGIRASISENRGRFLPSIFGRGGVQIRRSRRRDAGFYSRAWC